jgi:hypothetical protein
MIDMTFSLRLKAREARSQEQSDTTSPHKMSYATKQASVRSAMRDAHANSVRRDTHAAKSSAYRLHSF